MITITSTQIIDYLPVIKDYVDFDNHNDFFDKYINKCLKTLTRLLLNDEIDINNNLFDTNEDLIELVLSFIVYNVYLALSYRVEADRYFIEELKDIYNSNYSIFKLKQKQVVSDINIGYLG